MNSLRQLTGDDRFRLKWPNDVLVDGAKLAGILLEGVTLLTRSHHASPAVLIGVGVNVKHHPANLPYAATNLAELGWECDANDVFAALTDAFASRLEQWDCARDFASIRADWIDAAAGVGGPVSVSLPDRTVTGTYTGIDEDGRLLVVTDAGEQIIDAGEVMLRGKAA